LQHPLNLHNKRLPLKKIEESQRIKKRIWQEEEIKANLMKTVKESITRLYNSKFRKILRQ
jgi:hypothetical protein